MTSLKIAELATISAVAVLGSIPWHTMAFIPPPLILFIAVGAGLAVVMIPADRRSLSVSITTALAGICVGILFTEWIIDSFSITSPPAAKAVAGLLGLGGLPFAGLALRLIDWTSNNPQTWLGRLIGAFLPPKPDPKETQLRKFEQTQLPEQPQQQQ